MLTHLHIRDFAIIDEAEIEFRPGLTVLTGETGAGKSIIVEALQLLCGGRAGTEAVRHGADRAEVTASFDPGDPSGPLAKLLREQSIDNGDELTIRRVVTADGRSRAYLNGQSVPVQLLRDVGVLLVDIHGQHEFQSLVRPAAQRELLDASGGLDSLAGEVGGLQRVWLTLLNRALDLESRVRERDARTDLLQFQVRELEALDMKDGELMQLLEERTRLANRGRLVEAAREAGALLYESDEGNAHASTSRALAALKAAGAHDPRLAGIAPMVEEALINLHEAARELAHYAETLDHDTNRQAEVERRLAAFEELARKHRVATAELPARLAQLRSELAGLEHADTQLATLRKEQAEALTAWRTRAAQLSSRRTATAKSLSKEITQRMQTLGMAGGRFQIDVSPLESPEPAPHGLDQIEFRVSANPGQPLRPLAKVASGGELARLSLAVQVSRAGREGRCMVFDEVDAGIGGAVAEIVGAELRALGDRSQVLSVTHLPQVASQGHHQLRVSKLTDGKTTRTQIVPLDADARVEEIARMLGGVEVTDKARAHAREMLGLARRAVRPAAVPVKNQ
ncbi:MAG: DNA repair protein RecN [Steroidobacteraceae bacterium]|nr:DNA repair protein RecN [Steroidobacteraceae bacterium]